MARHLHASPRVLPIAGAACVAVAMFLSSHACFVSSAKGHSQGHRGSASSSARLRGQRLQVWKQKEETPIFGAGDSPDLSALLPRSDGALANMLVSAIVFAGVFVATFNSVSGLTVPENQWHTRVDSDTEYTRWLDPDGSALYQKTSKTTRETKTGAPIAELFEAASSLDSASAQSALSNRLLDELAATESTVRSADIQDLLWQTWFFNENSEAAKDLSDGTLLMNQGDYIGAELRFLKAITLEPTYAEAWNKLATVDYLLGDYAESLDEIEQTLQLRPRHFGAIAGKGLVMLKLQQYDKAVEAFQQAQEVMPASESVALDVEYAKAMQQAAEEGVLGDTM